MNKLWLKKWIPRRLYRPLVVKWRQMRSVEWGAMRRLEPFSRQYGFDRGLPVDRYYVESFLTRYSQDVQGHVLEIGDPDYTEHFGGSRVTRSDVLHVEAGNPRATLVGDLTQPDGLPSDTFDCLILTQVLLCIYDVRAARHTCYRMLKPGGVLLITVPCISRMCTEDDSRWGDYWRFTGSATRRLLEEEFGADCVNVEVYGNMLSAVAMLYGLSADEMRQEELEHRDRDYEVIIGGRAVKPGGTTPLAHISHPAQT